MICKTRASRGALVLLCSLLLFAGCESTPRNMRERFPPVPPKVETFEADARRAFSAAQLALKRLDFNLTRTSVTGYRIEAESRGNTGMGLEDSRRLHAYLGIVDVGENECAVSLRLIAVREGRSWGSSHEHAVSEHDFYEKYFAALRRILAEQPAAGAPGKN